MANAITTNTPAAIAITDILTIKNLETGKMVSVSYKQAPDESEKEAVENFKFDARNSVAFEYAIMRGDTVLYSTVKATKAAAPAATKAAAPAAAEAAAPAAAEAAAPAAAEAAAPAPAKAAKVPATKAAAPAPAKAAKVPTTKAAAPAAAEAAAPAAAKAAKVPTTKAAAPAATKAAAPAAAEAVSWPEMRSAARIYLDLSVGGAVAAATDKGAAIMLVSRAIVGAILEYGFSGNDSRIEAARKELAPVKGAGQKLRALALKALEFRVDTTKKGLEGDRVKPRSLKILGQAGMLEWCDLTALAISAEIAPVARETSAVVAEVSPVAGEASAVVAEVSPVAGEASAVVAEASPSVVDPIDDIMALTHALSIESLIELKSRISSLIESLSEVTSA